MNGRGGGGHAGNGVGERTMVLAEMVEGIEIMVGVEMLAMVYSHTTWVLIKSSS